MPRSLTNNGMSFCMSWRRVAGGSAKGANLAAMGPTADLGKPISSTVGGFGIAQFICELIFDHRAQLKVRIIVAEMPAAQES
jgi:hypothetical protein